MTYHGGIEDGKAALATQILNIMNDPDKSDNAVFGEILRLCKSLQKEPTREHEQAIEKMSRYAGPWDNSHELEL